MMLKLNETSNFRRLLIGGKIVLLNALHWMEKGSLMINLHPVSRNHYECFQDNPLTFVVFLLFPSI